MAHWLLAAALALAQDAPAEPPAQPERAGVQPWIFSAPGSQNDEFLIQIPEREMRAPRLSPKNAWEFNWVIPGLGRAPSQPDVYSLRFRVYLQQRDRDMDLGPLVARNLLQLWGYNIRNLRLDHSSSYFLQLVDVYLCDLGKPGGEQRFGEDPFNTDEFGRPRRANQIYIYDLKSFVNPIEMVRELAHEYGHATLPPLGGFETPEAWGNGYFGENLYMMWLERDARAGKLQIVDTMGADPASLTAYVNRNVLPLAQRAAQNGPSAQLLKRKDRQGMDHFIGLGLHAERILPARAFQRSLILAGNDAHRIAETIVEASAEQGTVTLRVPNDMKGKPIWIPLGKGQLNGLKPMETRMGWAKVRPTADIIRVRHPEP